jgi:S1-C subfamily serine protease
VTGGSTTGYAIPINTVLAAEQQIAAGHRGPGVTLGTSGFLGVVVGSSTTRSPSEQRSRARAGRTQTAASVTEACAPSLDTVRAPAKIARAAEGALVDGVLCGTGAATAGIAAGDVITAADGRPIASAHALNTLISDCRPDALISVTWVTTAGATRTALIRLSAAPAV